MNIVGIFVAIIFIFLLIIFALIYRQVYEMRMIRERYEEGIRKLREEMIRSLVKSIYPIKKRKKMSD